MIVEQLYTNCLAEAAYYIESNGEVAIIDPLRETDPYLERAAEDDAKIKYIFETHFHADFVSGHVDLATKTGATIIYGPGAQTEYNIHQAKDGEEFKVGAVTIRVLHTPGHTLESSCFLLIDENGKNHSIFTGDTLFVGDVGRPDLAVKSDLSTDDLAGMLFDSLRNKVMTLEDEVIVYPAHGAGSSCGKNIGSETFSTIGAQKASNYALQDISREEFIRQVTDGILPPPQYFPKNAMLNKLGYDNIDAVMTRGNRALTLNEFDVEVENGALVIDTRNQDVFRQGFIPGSLFFGIDGSFATWIGTLIENLNQRLVIICDEGREEEVILRLARVGYDNAAGYLQGGFATWTQAGRKVDTIASLSAEGLEKLIQSGANPDIADVRKPTEFSAEHIDGAMSYPLNYINKHLHDLDKSKTWHVHCRSGYRSMVAASIMRKNGYKNVIDIANGMKEIEKTGIELSDFVCPSKLVGQN